MFIISSYATAVIFCMITMLCWGSWANTQKASSVALPFEFFYWDYVIGIWLTSLIAAMTLGSFGTEGRPFLSDLDQADMASIGNAFLGGIIFNIANILLSAAIAIAGMSVAFPVGIGLALVVGVIMNYAAVQKGDPLMLGLGVSFVLLSVILNALAYRSRQYGKGEGQQISGKGLVLALIAGILMSFFYRFIAASMDIRNFSSPEAGKLTPYSALFVFSAGILISNVIFNTVLIRKPITGGAPLKYADYFKTSFNTHLLGIAGGLIWCTGTLSNLLASEIAGPAISYGLGQGATLIAALWGVFIWKEFQGAGTKVNRLLALMFFFFVAGLSLVVYAGRMG